MLFFFLLLQNVEYTTCESSDKDYVNVINLYPVNLEFPKLTMKNNTGLSVLPKGTRKLSSEELLYLDMKVKVT